jgi:glyoxylase-like metal-dependent hydrolase (beta-lactamase superfamily II)/rhodanese-related sulfurtransferase
VFIKQLYTNCLAEAAYYIEDDGEAAIVDPIREPEPYIQLAKERGVKIKYVFETHFHADFVSGHIDLANKTGARIIFGPGAETSYNVYNAKDAEEFKVGNVTIRAIHTPGHTPESTCYLLTDEKGKEYCIFTGDTLFVGDVGRPDLLDGKMTKEELAGMMYDSLNNKLKKLADEVIVYPAHGPGSACGKSIGKATWSTIGEQKKTNYALREMNKEAFIKELIEGLEAPPAYFFKDAAINKSGYQSFDQMIKKTLKPLSVEEFENEIKGGALILDTRVPADFEKGFIKGALNFSLNGSYAIWVATLIDINQPLIIVAEEGKEEESITRLARVGFENIKGFMKGGFEAWKKKEKPIETITSIDVTEFSKRLKENCTVLDVRKISEAASGHVKNAVIIPLTELERNIDSLSKDEPVMVHCTSGYRSAIGTSILKARGFKNVINVFEGWSKIKNANVPIEQGIDGKVALS